MSVLIVALLASSIPSLAVRETFEQDIAIVGGTLVDVSDAGQSSDDRPNSTILIRHGRITAVGHSDQISIPAGTKILKANGKYLVPGLIDGFGSLRNQHFADAYLYEGVTSVFVNIDPSGQDGEHLVTAPAQGPRLLLGRELSGRAIAASVNQAGSADRAADLTADDFEQVISEAASAGTRAVVAGLDVRRDQVQWIANSAKAHGLGVAGEVARATYPEASEGGAKVFLHNDRYQTALAAPQEWQEYARDPTGKAAGVAYRAACQTVHGDIALKRYGESLVNAGVALMPMLSIEATADDVGAPNPWASPAAPFVTPEELDDPVDPTTGARPYLLQNADRRDALQACARHRQDNDRQLHRLGVHYLAGSGAPAYGVLPGAGLHVELQLLQHIGLTPREALAAATSSIADAYGWKDIGQLEAGRAGDVLVLDQDPRVDIKALESISAVVHNGSLVDRPALIATARAQHALQPEAATSPSDASGLLQQAIRAQGGLEKLRAIATVTWTAAGYRNMVEESERPEGPYLTEFDTVTETHDLTGHRLALQTEADVAPFGPFSNGLVVDNGVAMRTGSRGPAPGSEADVTAAAERLALSPERLLLTALDARDVRREADEVLQSIPQQVVSFSLDGFPVRIYLNGYTHLPTAVDYSGPAARTGFWSFLGDVSQRTWYSFWWLDNSGLRFPMQWNIESNHLPDRLVHIRKIVLGTTVKPGIAMIPDTIRRQFAVNKAPADRDDLPLGLKDHPATELAPGIVFIPGQWNTTIVRQDDGVVILEAPISSGYSSKVIAEAHKRFPTLPIKAIITTSDAWPHLAGIREYVAEDVPVYALDLNERILRRVLDAPYRSRPDAQERRTRLPQFHLVSGKVQIGTGLNRLEIYPIRGETTERQLMVYFPEHRLLYGSDAFQEDDAGRLLFPQNVSELMDAVLRENLSVKSFFMMHVGLTPWSALARGLREWSRE